MRCHEHNKLLPHFRCEESERFLDDFEARMPQPVADHPHTDPGETASPAAPDTAEAS